MNVTFLRGKAPLPGEALGNAFQGFPYEGKLSPEATDEVDSAS